MERALQAGADPQGAGDHSKTATLLRLVLLWGLVIGVAAAAGHALILGPTGVVMAVYPVVFAAFVALLLLLRGGHVQATGLGLLLLVWAAIIASALTDGGLFGVSISGFTLVVIGATLLFDRRLVLVSLALCFAAQVGFLALALLGLTPAATTPDTPGQAFLARAIHLSAAGMFLYLAMRSLQHARQRARDNDSRAAELLREATSARNYADNILTAMAESLIVIDAAGRIQTVNKATLELLGHERDALVGRPFKTLLPDLGDHPGDRPSGRPNEQHEAIDARLATWLLEPSRGGPRVRCTQQEIADALGTAREVVSRTLAGWQKAGWVRTGRGWIEVLRPADRAALTDKSSAV